MTSNVPAVDRSAVLSTVEAVRALPYVWPGRPDAESARRSGVGTCASKHALLAEEFAAVGILSRPLLVLGPLVPAVLLEGPDARPALRRAAQLMEVHECLTAELPDVGPVLIDLTWDPPLIERGLPGTTAWDGASDMVVAVDPVTRAWSPNPAELRVQKEAIRARMYRSGDRSVRDSALAGMSALFERWRRSPGPGTATGESS